LTPHAFPSGRVKVLELLSAQAAISLENATLYSDLQRENTDRKRAEQELRQSEAYLAEAQRLSQTGSFGWNVSSGETFWSDETFRIFGYDKAVSVTLDMVLQRIHPEDLVLVRRIIDRASGGRKDIDYEHRLLMPDGSVKHVQVVARALSDESGELEFVGAVMDVTAAKEAEQRLRQNERELRITVETIPAFVVSTQADGSVDFVSQSWVDYAGLSSEEWLGSAWMNAIHPEDRDRAVNKWRMALALGEAVELEVRFRRGECCSKCATSTYFGSAFILRILALTPKGLSRSRANPRGSSSIELFSRTDQ
jgi:PAS domain S-box-containing protein